MTTPVATFSKSALVVNQPMSLGSVKGTIGTIAFTTYATGGIALGSISNIPGAVIAILPIGGLTTSDMVVEMTATNLKLNSAEATETTDNTAGGSFQALVLHTGG